MARSIVKYVLSLPFALIALGCVAPGASAAVPPVQITAGGDHSCAVTAAGAVKCWGSDDYGQLGDGIQLAPAGNPTYVYRSTPTLVPGLSDIKMVSAGFWHTCALTNGGAVSCWSVNYHGQLGDGTETTRTSPVAVSGLSGGVQSISAGMDSTCAVTAPGGVKCWGDNRYGQLGDGTMNDSSTPVDVSGLSSGVDAVTVGDGHACALMDTGGVKCWGTDGAGGTLTPSDVNGLGTDVKALASGWYHTCALTNGGAVSCWGEMVNGTGFFDYIPPPGQEFLSGSIKAIDADTYTTCAVTTGGGGKCWGNGYNGQTGDGGGDGFRPTPVDVSGLTGATAIAVGHEHGCALIDTGGIKCWGRRGGGPNGLPPALTPVDVLWSAQNIDFPELLNRNLGDDFTPPVETSSGLPVTLVGTGACTVSGLVVHELRTGTCTVTASQPGSEDFDPAPGVTRSFEISPGPVVKITRAAATASTSRAAASRSRADHRSQSDRWIFRFHDRAAGARFKCSLDGKRIRKCVSGLRRRVRKVGVHVFRIRSTDFAGNVSRVRTARFRVRD